MNEYVGIGLTVLLTCIFIVLLWRFLFGFYPGSSFVVEEPPITANGLDDKQAKFIFFYTSWCPFAKKAWIPWRSLKQQTKNESARYGGREVIFEEVNIEKDKGKATLYNIQELPTFKIETSEEIYMLKGDFTSPSLKLFLEKALGEKSTR